VSSPAEALDALSRAFASRDLEAALACFADDADVVYAGSESGEVAAGRDEIRRLLAGLFEREVSYSWDVTRLLSSSRGQLELVVADAIGHSRGVGENEDFAYRLSGVLSREEDGWRWLQLHGAEPTVPGT
jgi:ketosteroid isomerase-like protein